MPFSCLSYLSGKIVVSPETTASIFSSRDTMIYVIQGYHKWMVDQHKTQRQRRDCMGFKRILKRRSAHEIARQVFALWREGIVASVAGVAGVGGVAGVNPFMFPSCYEQS